MAIFLDTGFYIGLVHSKDEHHLESRETLERFKTGTFGRIYTSNYVMIESATLAAARSGKDTRVMRNIRRYFEGDLTLAVMLRPAINEEVKIWDLFGKVNSIAEKGEIISFVDCANIVLCQRHQIDTIATFDEHFKRWLERIP